MQIARKRDVACDPPAESVPKEHAPGGPLATPTTSDGRAAADAEGEEA